MVPGKTTKLWLKRYEGTNIYIFWTVPEEGMGKHFRDVWTLTEGITKSLYLVRFTQSVRQYVIQTIVPDF